MYKVLLRNNYTSEERWVNYDMPWDGGSVFLWTEGNYGCDCNRHLFFERAFGREPDDDEHVCGDEKYTAVCAELPDGKRHELDAHNAD
ncbi:MAG TPA: hypothetical protein VGA88_08365 [Burkholderiales bacterium]